MGYLITAALEGFAASQLGKTDMVTFGVTLKAEGRA